jgi:hypothetical protein
MTHQSKIAAALALLAALLIGSPAPAGDSDSPKQDLKDRLLKLEDKVERLLLASDLTNTELKALNAEMRTMRERLDRIRATLRRIESSSPASRTSRFFDPLAPAPLPAARGTVRLDNRMPVTATWTIDGVSYSVAPFSFRTLTDRPVGALTYSVTGTNMGIKTVETTVRPNETLTLTAF